MRYLNQHTRLLGLEAPSFASPKEKHNNSSKLERQKSSSSDRKKNKTVRFDKNRTDRSERKRKRTDASDFETKSRGKSADKKEKGKVPFGKHCRRPSCKERGTHKITIMTNVDLEMINHLRCSTSTPTWAKRQERIRITNPRVM